MKTAVHAATASGETHNIFKALMENVNEAVFVIEPGTGRLLEANPQAAIALGYSIAELLALKRPAQADLIRARAKPDTPFNRPAAD